MHFRSPILHLPNVLQESSLVAVEFDPLGPGEAAAGLDPLFLQRGQASGKDGLP